MTTQIAAIHSLFRTSTYGQRLDSAAHKSSIFKINR